MGLLFKVLGGNLFFWEYALNNFFIKQSTDTTEPPVAGVSAEQYSKQVAGLVPSIYANDLYNTPYRWTVAIGSNPATFNYSNFSFFLPSELFNGNPYFLAEADDGDTSPKYTEVIPQSIFDQVPTGAVAPLFVSYDGNFIYTNDRPDRTARDKLLLFFALINQSGILLIRNIPWVNKSSISQRARAIELQSVAIEGVNNEHQIKTSNYLINLEGINYDNNEIYNAQAIFPELDPTPLFRHFTGKNPADWLDGTDTPTPNLATDSGELVYDNNGTLTKLSDTWGIFRVCLNIATNEFIISYGIPEGFSDVNIASVEAIKDSNYATLDTFYFRPVVYFIAQKDAEDFGNSEQFQIVGTSSTGII